MQRAAARRAAVIDATDLAQFQHQQHQNHLLQQQQQHAQQQQASQGMIAVGHPAAHAASMAMRTGFPQESQVQPEPGFRYAGTQGQDPYRRIAPRPPVGNMGPAPNHLPGPRQQQQQHSVQMQQGPPYGSPSTGVPMTTAQYNAYLAASNAIPGGHPTPRALVQLQNQTAAAMHGQRPSMQPQPARGGLLPSQGVQARNPAMANPAGQPGHSLNMQRVHPSEMDGRGMSPQLQQVYRVASQPQLSRQTPGQPLMPRPGLAAQRSVSQTQVPQARPRTIDLSPNPQPVQPPQHQQHAYAAAMHQQLQQQQQQQQMQAQHAQRPAVASVTGRQAVQSSQNPTQLQQQEQQPAEQMQESYSRDVQPQAHSKSSIEQVPSNASREPPPLQLDTQVARQQPGTPGPLSALSFQERRRSTSAQSMIVEDQQIQTSPAVPPSQPSIRSDPSLAPDQLSVQQPLMQPEYADRFSAQYGQQVLSAPALCLSPEDPLVAHVPPNAILQPTEVGSATFRLLQLGKALTAALGQSGNESLHAWIRNFYCPDAHVKFNLCDTDHGHNVYEIPVTSLARFYEVMRESGASSFQLLLESPREYTVHTYPNSPTYTRYVECSEMTWIVSYRSGCRVFSRGLLRATLDEVIPLADAAGRPSGPTVQIKHMEYTLEQHTETVERSVLIPKPSTSITQTASMAPSDNSQMTASPFMSYYSELSSPMKEDTTAFADLGRLTQGSKRKRDDTDGTSTSERKKSGSEVKAIDFGKSEPPAWSEYLGPAPISRMSGLNERAIRILEIAESVNRMGELINFSQDHGYGPLETLQRYGTYCVATGLASADGLYSPPSLSALPPSSTRGPEQSHGVKSSSASPESSDAAAQTSYAVGLPPSAPLPSIPRMAGASKNGIQAAYSLPNSPAEVDSSLFYRSNTLPGAG